MAYFVRLLIMIIIRCAVAKGFLYRQETQLFRVEKNSALYTDDDLIANVSDKSMLHCASRCMIHTDCCSSVHDKTTGTCGLYSCCSPVTTAAVYQNVLKKLTTPECNGLKDKCPVSQGYTYDSDLCLCLKYIVTAVLHSEAVAECAADNGELVKIDSSCKQQKVVSFLTNIPNKIENHIWIQGDKSSGTYKFDDGTEVTYFLWDTEMGEPEAISTEDPYISIKIPRQYKWYDRNTGKTSSTFCQIV